MYESFYGLKKKPFSMSPDPGFLYLSKKHQKALTLFEYGLMSYAGFCVITGEIGSGKTTVIRKLFENMDSSIAVGMITNTHQGFGELLDWVLSAFDIHDKGMSSVEKHQRFIDFLLEQYAARKTTLLIVDEAQNMAADKLEELRLISNVNSDKDQVLQVILVGQTGLKETLALPELEQLVQRISVDYHLGALDQEDTRGYIAHRLSVAGAESEIFTEEASDLIYKYSGGIPRLINLLCDTALVYGFADQQSVIDKDLVSEMIKERMKNSLVPLACTDQPAVPPQNIADSVPLAEEPVAQQADVASSNIDEEMSVEEVHDFSEKVMQATDVEDVVDTNKDSDAEEEIQYYNIVDSEQEAVSSELEEVDQAVASIEFIQPNKPKQSPLLKPMLLALFILSVVTVFYISNLDGDKTGAEISEAEANKYKKDPESINRSTSTVEQKAISDEIQKQLDESRKFQQEMMARQQEDRSRMEALEEQSELLKSERDEALINAKAEKAKRRAEKKAAQIAAKREQEAEKMAQAAIAEAMAAKQKAALLEELRIKEKLANEAALAEQQKKLDEAVEAVETIEVVEPEEASNEFNNKSRKKSEDARCQGVTARFLSVCR